MAMIERLFEELGRQVGFLGMELEGFTFRDYLDRIFEGCGPIESLAECFPNP